MNTLTFSYYLSQIGTKGWMAWEYNPFHNFRFPKDTDSKGRHPGELGFDTKDIKYHAGQVEDLDTELFNFNLKHPVSIECQPSYDGSVNLILNDGKNIPRLINSRFSVLPKNKYEVVDRIGNNDTNLYDDTQFDQDTSLYKTINYIPKITYNGVIGGGELPVGNYHLYLKYADADGNETDFVAESGLISLFIGTDGDPFSIQGGIKDQNSNKSIDITVSNMDPAYDYITVYYSRETSDLNQNSVVSAFKIDQKFISINSTCNIIITGNENKTEIPVSDINAQYFVADGVQAQAQAQNMLFLGNVHKPEINYADLQDISLRIVPTLNKQDTDKLIGNLDEEYNENSLSSSNGYEYYNTKNIYNYVGYWPGEIYRFGVVYILKDYTLSPVFNIRGKNTISEQYEPVSSVFKDDIRNYLEVHESDFTIVEDGVNKTDNAKGVVYIDNLSDNSQFKIHGIQMNIPKDALVYLQSLGIKGLFFVRQKRVPTILAQCLTLPVDYTSGLPLIEGTQEKDGTRWYIEGFLNDDGLLVDDYNERLKYVKTKSNNQFAGICPEYDLRQPYFNQLFTGSDFILTKYANMNMLNSTYDSRIILAQYNNRDETSFSSKIASLEDDTPLVVIGDSKFRGRAGEAEEAWRFKYIEKENKADNNYRVARGSWGPYLALQSPVIEESSVYNIRVPGYSIGQKSQYFKTRYYDYSQYYPIGDRIAIQDIIDSWNITPDANHVQIFNNTFYRGDCYICTFTHRLNRNFSDPNAPTNDEIVDQNTWKDNLKYTDGVLKDDDLQNINRGDVNAVKLGTWVTFKVLSTYNLNIRSKDGSRPDESALYGQDRSFYPLTYCSANGEFKIPESSIINDGFGKSSGQKIYYTLPDSPYIKNKFDNRIAYSDIAINDAFKNGYRVFKSTNYRDYPRVYGGLIKLIELQGSLIAIWEHGVGVIPVNERAVAGEGTGGNVFINTSNVLPMNPKILSDRFGSQWPESVLKTPYYIYGVDTVGKKIWRTNGTQFEIISDFKVQQFLNNNISLTERELDPIIGIRNVKTHYNSFKGDVMFTFYDNIYGFEEKVWNLCYNEILQKFITYYSWIPSYSENIDNMYFSFNRDTSKWITKLATSNATSNDADGIVLKEGSIIDNWVRSATLDIVNRALPTVGIIRKTFKLERDIRQNYKLFTINGDQLTPKISITDLEKYMKDTNQPVLLLNVECEIDLDIKQNNVDVSEFVTGFKEYQSTHLDEYRSVIAITTQNILNASSKEQLNLTTDFWKHGQSGIIDIKDKIKPCFWYGKQHPFEFEFVVVDNPSLHKIFDNLQIVSNHAAPESFHYEIIGDCFDFKDDKPNMYVRQEATKDLYQYNGSDIVYNRDFLDIKTNQLVKSRQLPLYYARQDTLNEVEDYYKLFSSPNKDYNNLSGTEVVYDNTTNEFHLWEHSKAVDITKAGRLRGNMQYKEDLWNVQINPIIIVEKNEDKWDRPPLSVGNSPIPNDVINTQLTDSDIPADLKKIGYTVKDIDISNWGVYPVRNNDGTITYADAHTRQEIKVKDKFIKIRVRYSGNELAIITALRTLYSISFS